MQQNNPLNLAIADAVTRQMDFLLEILYSGATPVVVGCGDEDHYCFTDEMEKLGWLERLSDPLADLLEKLDASQRSKCIRITRMGGVAYCTQFIEGDLMRGPVTEMVREFFQNHKENLKEWLEDMYEEMLGPNRMN